MPRHRCKNTISNHQDEMSPGEPSNPTAEGPEAWKTDKAEGHGFNMPIMNILRDLKEDRNKSISDFYE